MSITTTCRDIKELSPIARQAVTLLFQECYKAGIKDIFITETYRSLERQKYLYEQGRTRAGQKVTWTLKSTHANRRAWDIACSQPLSLYDVKTLEKVGSIARKLGITWGGDWKNSIDRPHFEITENWSIPKGYVIQGKVTIPTDSKVKVSLTGGGTVSKYELVEDKNSKVWRIQSGTYKTKEEAIKAFNTSGLRYATIRGSIK